MSELPTIFVQIASYRDPECQWTIKDLFDKADHPERVRVVTCWQTDLATDGHCFEIPSPRPANTISLIYPLELSRGHAWAHWQIQKHYDGEDYMLMIDSHMRFVPGWDSLMIGELGRCPTDKAFLSSYPPGYKPPNELHPDPKVSILRADRFDKNGAFRMTGRVLEAGMERPLPCAFLAGGFVFTRGAFVTEVPCDPKIYFADEELCLAARAFTHGWDGYAPSRILIYHYYYVPGEDAQRTMHWDDHKEWRRLHRKSRARRDYMLFGAEPAEGTEALEGIERFPLGGVRTMAEYEAFCGIDFRQQAISKDAQRGRNAANRDVI